MRNVIMNFLNERVIVLRTTGRDTDLSPETMQVAVLNARIERVQSNEFTSDFGVQQRDVGVNVYVVDSAQTVAEGDILELPDGEQREVISVDVGTYLGEQWYSRLVT